ncbi:hypothetical protein [Salinimicrobium gaetbulicola]|uniref:Uncharacterized protein n=1 Tax=Salinimicrobium gaetbulicola TaxID=999702 RepID=A0ABW3IIK7_9FLAO
MQIFNFDSYRNCYPEGVIFAAIQKLLQSDYTKFTPREKRYLIADFVKHISSQKLLDPTLDLLEDFELISQRTEVQLQIDAAGTSKNYSSEDLWKLTAISFSEVMIYSSLLKDSGQPEGIPQLSMAFLDRAVSSNTDEVVDFVKRSQYNAFIERNENLSLRQREEDLKAVISSMAKIDYENGTRFFQEEKEYLSYVKENLPAEVKEQEDIFSNPFPEVFKGSDNRAFLLFKEYLEQHVIAPYVDISFLFQQLRRDGLLYRIKHSDFTLWLKENHFISNKVFEILLAHGHFRSLSKSSSEHRVNNYRLIREKYFQ